MSTTYYAAVLAGCKVEKDKLFEKRSVSVKHDHKNPEEAKFCSECGAPLTYIDYVNHDEIYDEFWVEEFDTFYLVGVLLESVSEYMYPSFRAYPTKETFNEVKDIVEKLNKFGIFDADSFNTYLVLSAN